MKKLIVFDCDGVLVDSEIISNRVLAEILTKLGYPISTENSIKKFAGMNAASIQNIVQIEGSVTLNKPLADLIGPAILAALEKELNPLMLPALESDILLGLSKCVASSSPRERVLCALKVTKQNHFFKEKNIFTSAQVKHGKPAPDLFLFAAAQMGFAAKDCLVIEDSIPGIQAARSAGMHVIGFLGGSHTHFDWYEKRIASLNQSNVKNQNNQNKNNENGNDENEKNQSQKSHSENQNQILTVARGPMEVVKLIPRFLQGESFL